MSLIDNNTLLYFTLRPFKIQRLTTKFIIKNSLLLFINLKNNKQSLLVYFTS
jgi:hypothetical protein